MDIDYNEIDPICIPMVEFFNEIGLTTEYSCQGHNNEMNWEFYIIFNESVNDQDIINFMSKLKYTTKGEFKKWARNIEYPIGCKTLKMNWVYKVEGYVIIHKDINGKNKAVRVYDYIKSQYAAKQDLRTFKESVKVSNSNKIDDIYNECKKEYPNSLNNLND